MAREAEKKMALDPSVMDIDFDEYVEYNQMEHDDDPGNIEVEAYDPINKAMGIDLITDKIFGYLPLKDLLNCGGVNSTWHHQSRNYVKLKRKCLAVIPARKSCKHLQTFSGVLMKSWNIPYNGFLLKTKDLRDDHLCISTVHCLKDLPRTFNRVLSYIVVKHLHICISVDLRIRVYDPIAAFVKEIFSQQSANIHEISLAEVPFFKTTVARQFGYNTNLKSHWLPNLRELNIPDNVDYCKRNSFIVKELILSSPHLAHMVLF